MVNLLIYAGFNVQSEVCFWAVLGILRTILDASVAFKVKSNLKQIWQMRLPSELDVRLQRVLRAMVSGVMVVQCVSIYVYLAAYIVLLYPIFLEEKPALVLPWLLLSLIRLLCELVNLSIGLATCVLLGSGKPPCVKFVLSKITKIALSVYMWKLVHWLYQILQAETYKPIAMVLPASKPDDEGYKRGLELAIRRRRTKSLLSKEELRQSILSDLCQEKTQALRGTSFYKEAWSSGARSSEFNDEMHVFQNLPMTSNNIVDTNPNDDCINIEVVTPRDSDRVLDQFVTMILKIRIYLKMGLNNDSLHQIQINDNSERDVSDLNVDQSAIYSNDVESPPSVTSLSAGKFSYIHDYPGIFLKDTSQRKLLQESTNALDKQNGRRSRISVVRMNSDFSNKINVNIGNDASSTSECKNNNKLTAPENSPSSSENDETISNGQLKDDDDVGSIESKSNTKADEQ
ncbi:uncharacterized protein LOC121732806 [Aricia agestis]|uniref:uncharacterized protein LOC121732806 n=1 Tax=Aricia agestis TaxID=91739 RepID=UPI001C20C028|nr:uncharacterized protein LOC121732806 [Aricia agestis]